MLLIHCPALETPAETVVRVVSNGVKYGTEFVPLSSIKTIRYSKDRVALNVGKPFAASIMFTGENARRYT